MAHLDKFIQALFERRGEALTLVPGASISLEADGGKHALIDQILSGDQIQALVLELAPAEVHDRVTSGGEATFTYTMPTRSVTASVAKGASGMTLRLRPAATPVVTPSAASTAHAPPPTTHALGATHASGMTHAARVRAPAARNAMDTLLKRLIDVGGSDLHLRVGQPPILRRDGSLVREPGNAMVGPQVQAMLEAIMPERNRLEHLETGDSDFAYAIEGLARFRVNSAMDRGGPVAVIRVIPQDIPTCEQMGISQEVQNLCLLTKGLVVVTGPTGSGKTTTLAAMVDKMNAERDDHILTIEDPIEFVHKSKRCLVTHRQVGEHTMSFQSGLRAALREDPDIVLIGELRDLETVAIAIETAETGHLVFGTLHTTTAASTVDRIIDQFSADRQSQIRVMLSESLRGVVAQTLLRRKGGGRVAAREVLLTTSAISNLIREGKTFQIPSIIQTSRKVGMMTLTDSLMELIDQGIVEPREAYMKAVDKVAITTALKSRGLDTSFLGGG